MSALANRSRSTGNATIDAILRGNGEHKLSCICAFCAPVSAAAPSPIVQSAPARVSSVESDQVLGLFAQLDTRGKVTVLAMMTAAVRLCQGRG